MRRYRGWVVGSAGDAEFEDLTARARIRDAALRLIGERGFDAATVREIARAAGVSGGLVRHHFGSKEGLRDACDSYALKKLMRLKEQAVLEGQMTNPGFMSAAQPELLAIYRYFARSLVDGSPAASAMFDTMVDLGEEWLARHHADQVQDARAYAALLVAMEVGVLTAREQVSRAMGVDILSPQGHLKLAKAKLDFYSQPLLDPATAAEARRAIDQLRDRLQLASTRPTATGEEGA